MIKSEQMEDLNKEGFHYITAITKPQIRKLLKTGVIQIPGRAFTGTGKGGQA